MACNECNNNCVDNNVDCACVQKDMSTDCSLYTGDDLECSGIEKNTILTVVIQKLDAFICNIRTEVIGYLTLVNIGTGAKVYKGISGTGNKEIRSITETGDLITVNENENDISIGINEQELESTITTIVTTVVENEANTYNVNNLSNGAEVYKDSTTVGNNVTFNQRTIKSDSLNVVENSETINIELSNFDDFERFIVNNLYTGTEELGTASKPFKTIQNALDAFVGTGSINNPENQFSTIVVQKGNSYNFTGNFNYRNINVLIEENAIVNHNPIGNDFLIDKDVLTNIKSDTKLVVREGAVINLNKKGFRNRGSTGGAAQRKTLNISGGGTITLNGAKATGDVLFEVNYDNQPGYVMFATSNITCENVMLRSVEKDFYNIGLDASVTFNRCGIRHSFVENTIDPNSRSFDQKGGSVTINDCTLFINGGSRVDCFTLSKDSTGIPKLTGINNTLLFPSTIDNFVTSLDALSESEVTLNYTTSNSNTVPTNMFKAVKRWEKVEFTYNLFRGGSIDENDVDLTKLNTVSTTNIIGNKVIEHLVKYNNRAAALAALGKNAKFINTNNADANTDSHYIDITL